MAANDDLLVAFELHSPEKIRAALDSGADPSQIESLIEMYTRSRRFRACLRAMLDAGAKIDDPLLEAILLDDTDRLHAVLSANDEFVDWRVTMRCAFTPLNGATRLHVAAEYNSIACLQVLIKAGADVNAAATDGHTPLFHTVNSNGNFARASMELLVASGAELDVAVRELVWGQDFEWETMLFDVTPISYALYGLLPQFHRDEAQIYSNIAYLYERRHNAPLALRNVPNRYLRKS